MGHDGIDPLEIVIRHVENLRQDFRKEMLTVIYELGEVKQALRHGHETFQDQSKINDQFRTAIGNLDTRLRVQERITKKVENEKPSRLSEITDFLKAFWPYMALGALVAAKIVLGTAEPVINLIEHFAGKG